MSERRRAGVSRGARALVAVGLGLLAACGGAKPRGGPASDFACKERRVEYVATGSLMYAEQGIRLTCAHDRPTLTRYFTTSAGKQTEQTGRIGPDDWDKAWKEFDAAGWRFLEDCTAAPADEREPLYTFEISDGDRTKTFRCQGNQLPFPYEALRNALDFAAAELPER